MSKKGKEETPAELLIVVVGGWKPVPVRLCAGASGLFAFCVHRSFH